ncbi:MAG: MFS transporter [Chloroflexi bacterium]|nr:MFS transporter [Chloroflexota bacterium]
MFIPALARRRPRIYYGWYILGVVMLDSFLSAGLSQLFMSIMLKPMTEEMGWSRTATTGAITIGTLTAGLLSPLLGRLADRYGPRLLTTVGTLVTAGMFFLLASLAEQWQFYLGYIVGRSIALGTLSGVVAQTAVANWFRRMRGRAMGLHSMALAGGGSVLSFVAQLILEAYGWRMVFLVFGIAVLTLLVLPAALVLRRRPEDLGLLPDGDRAPPAAEVPSARQPREEEPSWTLSEAIRTPALWLLVGALFIAVMANTAVGFHQVAYYTDVGIAPTAAVVALSLYALVGALSSGVWGFLTERFSERVMAAAAMLLATVAILYLLTVRSLAGALLFAVLFGMSSRGESTLVNIILAQYYGRRFFGSISGFVNPFMLGGVGLGPSVSALAFDLTGAYQVVFICFAGTSTLAAVLLWLARPPTRKSPSPGPAPAR